MFGKRQASTRGEFILGMGLAATYTLRSIAMPAVTEYGLTALLDGSGMVPIVPGEFQMGSEDGNADERVHRVRISRGFEMSKCEVTQAQWEAVMGEAHAEAGSGPVNTDGEAVNPTPSRFKGPSLPVDSVSWVDVALFLKRLNARDPKHLWRLPTEAEWEYACKAGNAKTSVIDSVAWYKANSGDQTHPVATKRPNSWGLYDMQGNVQEWVQDWYSPEYDSSPVDPKGPN